MKYYQMVTLHMKAMEFSMCQLCAPWAKSLTVKEKLSGANELIRTGDNLSFDEILHIAEIEQKLLGEYADEISKEVMEKTK